MIDMWLTGHVSQWVVIATRYLYVYSVTPFVDFDYVNLHANALKSILTRINEDGN